MSDNNSFVIVNHSDVSEINYNYENYQLYINKFKYYMNIFSEEVIELIYNSTRPYSGPPLFYFD